MKKSQHQRISAQVKRLEAAINFDELGALHDELPAGNAEKATLWSACDKLASALQMLRILELPE